MACGALQHPVEKNNLAVYLEVGSTPAFSVVVRRIFKGPAFLSERHKPLTFCRLGWLQWERGA